ncbi:MAG: hypothetical protein LAN62_08510 [Acidobacteriia bacterium]|nr:hypothetical protein [Terriglobia bacterium]
MGANRSPLPEQPQRAYEVEWTTISYRTIAFYAVLALVGFGVILYLIAPNYFSQKARDLLAAVSAGLVRPSSTEAAASKREAHFVNLDGTVRVRKAQSAQWIRADYNTNLEKGDYVQTGSEGVARIIFADGTNYMLKPDSLIVVEESKEDPVTKATRVAVQVSSGAVDLSTGRFEVPGSTSRLTIENAVATLAEESRATVRNDPDRNVHELTVQQGEATVTRGSTTIRLGQYEQATFDRDKAGLVRQRVIAPPELSEPANMALTMSQDPKSANLDFAWSSVAEAAAYRLQISPSGMFSNLVVDRKVVGKTTARVAGLEEGTYYWVVSSIDAKGVESQPSMANRFSLVQQVESGTQAYLEVTNIIQHGRVLEVVGKTEPGSTVIINNEQVFSIAPDGTFRHFTSQLARSGANQITITAQNRRGDMHTIRKSIVVE